MWNWSNRYTLTVQGIKSVDGDIAPKIATSFFAPFKPFWGSLDMIELDLRTIIGTIPSYVLYMYVYKASLDAWNGLKKSTVWSTVPDPQLTLDELLITGVDESLVQAIDCYVRYRTQYLLLTSKFPYLAAGGVGEKTLGDFTISYKGNVSDLKNALDDNITPNMNACYWQLVGEQQTKPAPKIVIRGASAEAVRRHKKARTFMPPGISHRRNWQQW